MWVPPAWLISAALHGAAMNSTRTTQRQPPPVAERTTKVVGCEECKRSYAYALKAFGHPASRVQEMLAAWIEAIPCPACGWYQSNMIPQARKRHRRWMLNVGRCLTFGLIPVALFVGPIVGFLEPIFVASVVSLLAVGIGMLVWRRHLAQSHDPNEEDVDARLLGEGGGHNDVGQKAGLEQQVGPGRVPGEAVALVERGRRPAAHAHLGQVASLGLVRA